MNGSMRAVLGSGISSMSEASMPFQPAMEEPSNACMPRLEFVHVEMRHRYADVLLFATGISETEINEFDFVVLDHFQYIGGLR